MVLYNENRKIFVINDNYKTNGINYGQCGEIYHYDSDKCVKIYYTDCSYNCRISKNIYEQLKDIDSDYLIKFYELFYSDPFLEHISGYLTKYYQSENFDFFEKSIDYNLYIMNELLKLFKKLSYNNIITSDVKKSNIIYNNEKIIIIDPDLFYQYSDLEICKRENYKNLIYLFKSIYRDEFRNLDINYKGFNPFQYLDDLFDFEPNEQIVDNLSKKLKKYKYPKDYFLERK